MRGMRPDFQVAQAIPGRKITAERRGIDFAPRLLALADNHKRVAGILDQMCNINSRRSARKGTLRCDPVSDRMGRKFFQSCAGGASSCGLGADMASNRAAQLPPPGTFGPRSQDCAANPEHQ